MLKCTNDLSKHAKAQEIIFNAFVIDFFNAIVVMSGKEKEKEKAKAKAKAKDKD